MDNKGSKSKGSAFERKVARLIAAYLGVDQSVIKRTQPQDPFRQIHGDIEIPEHLRDRFPYTIENKAVEGWTLESFMSKSNNLLIKWAEQAIDARVAGTYAIVMFTRNYMPIFVFLVEERDSFGMDSMDIYPTPCAFIDFDINEKSYMGILFTLDKFFEYNNGVFNKEQNNVKQ